MHEYVVTPVKRHHVISTLASIAVLISFGLGWLFHRLELPSYAAPPTGALAFGLIFGLYDRLLWRLKFASKIPNLNGTWQGTIDIRKDQESEPRCKRCEECEECKQAKKANEAKQPEKLDCTVRIHQTWRKISIKFKTTKTQSGSVTAYLDSGGLDRLHYEYDVLTKSEPLEKDSTTTASRHFGTAHLEPVDDSWRTLVGEYYNDRAFQRWGEYEIERVSRKSKA